MRKKRHLVFHRVQLTKSKTKPSHDFVRYLVKKLLCDQSSRPDPQKDSSDSTGTVLQRTSYFFLFFFHLQFDSKGRNFLHSAIQNVDIETVLFLIGVSANVNSRIQDSSHRTPLHLAVSARSEIIVRHLVRLQCSLLHS